jgi:hypothetical protein
VATFLDGPACAVRCDATSMRVSTKRRRGRELRDRGTWRALQWTMRLRTLFTFLAFGLAARAFVRHQRSRGVADDRDARWDDLAPDPDDPVQAFDEAFELQVEPLDVDALSNEDVEAAQDLAGLEWEVDQIAQDDDAVIDMVVFDVSGPRDAGDLYGVHTPVAVDPIHPDGDRAAADGQTWLEALEASAIENGAAPGRALDDIVDDEDLMRPPHASDRRDRPVADFGSGGRRGL